MSVERDDAGDDPRDELDDLGDDTGDELDDEAAGGPGIDIAELGLLRRVGDRVELTQWRAWPVERDALWRGLTDPDLLAIWIGRPERALDEPGDVRLDQGGGTVANLSIREVVDARSLATTWSVPGEHPADVRLELAEIDVGNDGGIVELTLTYSTTDEAQARSAVGAWLSFLDELGRVLQAASRPPDGVSPATFGIMRLAAAVEVSRYMPVR